MNRPSLGQADQRTLSLVTLSPTQPPEPRRRRSGALRSTPVALAALCAWRVGSVHSAIGTHVARGRSPARPDSATGCLAVGGRAGHDPAPPDLPHEDHSRGMCTGVLQLNHLPASTNTSSVRVPTNVGRSTAPGLSPLTAAAIMALVQPQFRRSWCGSTRIGRGCHFEGQPVVPW